jgi:hypothetical protein
MQSEKNLDQLIRRLARRSGCIVRKSRSKNVAENRGGYMILDSTTAFPVFGFWFELSPEAVIEYFTTWNVGEGLIGPRFFRGPSIAICSPACPSPEKYTIPLCHTEWSEALVWKGFSLQLANLWTTWSKVLAPSRRPASVMVHKAAFTDQRNGIGKFQNLDQDRQNPIVDVTDAKK